MEKMQELDRLFNPSSLAVIGASKDEEKSGGRFLKGLIDSGFKGKLYPVNPNESEIMGLSSYSSVRDIPGEIDLALLSLPARIVPQVIADCSQKGVKFAIVHSAGFGELGIEGKGLEEKMLEFARQGGTRIIGPNCMGIYSPEANINTILFETAADDKVGPVAFVGQSGWVTENVIQLGYERGLRFSKAVSIGNQSDLSAEDLLEYFASDSNTSIISFYIEGFKRPREFLQLAKQVSKKKPVVVWKAGRTEVGARVVASHTGSLAGNNLILEAALAQGGAAMAQNLDELIDLIVGFTCPVLPRGRKVGILVEAGGGAAAGADAALTFGLEVPILSAENQRELEDRLKDSKLPISNLKNPVDIVWDFHDDGQVLMQCSRVILREVDALVVVTYENFNSRFVEAVTAVRDETAKPIFVAPGHYADRRDGMSLLIQNGVPSFNIPERAIKAISTTLRYSNYQQS